jgi:hypothetical protein
MMQTIEFENMLQGRVEELNLIFRIYNNLRQSDILVCEIDTLECVLGRLSDLKYGNKIRAKEIAEANLISLQLLERADSNILVQIIIFSVAALASQFLFIVREKKAPFPLRVTY